MLLNLFIILSIFFYHHIDAACSGSTEQLQVQALQALFTTAHQQAWNFQANWVSTGSSADPCVGGTSQWDGVVCTTGNGCTNAIYQLNLGFNNLKGTLPTQIGALTTLIFLNMESNSLTGSLPTQMGLMVNLVTLQIMNNQISGAFPTQIGNLVNLNKFIVFNNRFSGSLPTNIGGLVKVDRFEFDNNLITGTIPTQIALMTTLTYWSGNQNQIVSPLPAPSYFITLHNSGALRFFNMANNSFTNPVPTQFAPIPSAIGTGTAKTPKNAPAVDLTGSSFFCTLPDNYTNIAHSITLSNNNGRFLCTLSGSTGSGYYAMSNTITAPPCTSVDFSTISASEGYYDQQPTVVITGINLDMCKQGAFDYRTVYFGKAIAPITASSSTQISVTVPLAVNALSSGQVGTVSIYMMESNTKVKMTSTAFTYTYKKKCDAPCDPVLYPDTVAGCNELTGQCVCVAPYITNASRSLPTQPYCTVVYIPCTPADCNGPTHGVCDTTRGVCICNSSWTGVSCDVFKKPCPQTSVVDPKNVCLNQGYCCSNLTRGTCDFQSGICTCLDNFKQTDCSTKLCPNNCYQANGWGTCNQFTGLCSCNVGHAGSDCSLPNFSCPNGTYIPQTCSGPTHGSCDVTTGNCVCLGNYRSSDACSTQPCPANCQGHGTCNNITGVCTCDSTHVGVDCSIPDFNCTTQYPGTICSGHGNCSRITGTCICDSPWLLPGCAIQPCPANCNLQGKCVNTTGQCICDSGWGGDDCSIANHTCPKAGNGVECYGSGRGSCNKNTGFCSCTPPWLASTACEAQNCATLRDCSYPNGVCNNQTGTCTCDATHTGADCSLPYLLCVGKNNCTYSEGHGICDTYSGNCICSGSWNQPDCLTKKCPLDCSGHGICDVSTGVCNCTTNWIGLGCEISDISCPQYYDPISQLYIECNGQGTCDRSTGTCVCDAGYDLADCSGLQCPQNCNVDLNWGVCNQTTGICKCSANRIGDACQTPDFDCVDNCNDHGICNRQLGQCTCTIGYDPATNCKDRLCANNCGSNGVCNKATGNCDCLTGYQGASCQIQQKNCDNFGLNTCGGHGVCDLLQGRCFCDIGWDLGPLNTTFSATGQCSICDATNNYVPSPDNPGTCYVPVECTRDCQLAVAADYATCNTTTGLCTCVSGRVGTNCDIFVCNPQDKPCNLHGTCVGPFTCKCDGGYSGDECQTKSSNSAQVAMGAIIGVVCAAVGLLGLLYGARRYAIHRYKSQMGNQMEMR